MRYDWPMATRTPTLPPANASDKSVRQQLTRILASKTFSQVDRLKRFVNFIVDETVEGRGSDLKEYVIGVQVFGKEPSFDPRTDPIVRVQARRLRTRLARYYRDEGNSDEIVVDLPKGGYAPVFRPRDDAPAAKRSLTATLVGRNTVAVLPLADYSPGASLDYFCRGLRDEIVQALDLAQGLARPGRPARRHRGQAPHREAAALLITGGVRSARDQLRVTIHLVDGASGFYLWSESTDVDADPVAGQEAIAKRIAEKLAPEVRRRSVAGTRTQTDNLAARNLYLQGRYHLNQRTEEGLHKAVDFFEKAIVEDTQFSLAHSGLSDAYGLLAHYGVLGPADVLGEGGVERRVGGDARRPLGRGAHVAGARQGHAGLGLRRRRAAVPARHPTQSALLHRASLVRDVVPGADGPARRSARTDPARAVARSGVVDHRPRRRGHSLLPTRLRRRAGTVRSHHRAESALRAGVSDARLDPGAAAGLRRVGRGVPPRGRPRAELAAHAERAGAHAGAVREAASARSTRCTRSAEMASSALRLAVRVRDDAVRRRRSGDRLSAG